MTLIPRSKTILLALLLIPGASCTLDEPETVPPGAFAFAVFGDAPYRSWEEGRYRRIRAEINQADLQWMLHVGDIFWYPCSDENYERELADMNSIRHPVIYTPGDNDWTDCHELLPGGYDPLERLAKVRNVFFSQPRQSLGGRAIPLETQGDDPEFSEFVENARWRFGGFLFATIHMVGSSNAMEGFEGRTEANDAESVRRNQAVLAWIEEAFAIATSENLHGVVLVQHAEIGFVEGSPDLVGFEAYVDRLADMVKGFSGSVFMIHGDNHVFKYDHPLLDRETGEVLENFTRLETYGSPFLGWVRVVMDSVSGEIVECEPHLASKWRLF